MQILITGASGQVGQAILRHYQDQPGQSCWLAFRRSQLPSSSHRYFDFTDPEGSQSTLAQTDVLFILRPPQLADVEGIFAPLLRVAVEEGVWHMLFLSVQGEARGYIGVLLLLHYLPRFQSDPEKTGDIFALTQKEPSSLRTYLEANRDTWNS